MSYHQSSSQKQWWDHAKNHIKKDFKQFCISQKPLLQQIQKQHFALLLNKGFPKGLEKPWKFSNIQNILHNALASKKQPASKLKPSTDFAIQNATTAQDFCYHFHNGNLQTSPFTSKPTNLKWCTWQTLTKNFPCWQWIVNQLNAHTSTPIAPHTALPDGFLHLACAMPINGYILFVPKNYQSPVPLSIHFSFNSYKKPFICNMRNFIFMEEGAKLTLTENISATNSSLINIVTDTYLSQKSALNWAVQDGSLSDAQVLSHNLCNIQKSANLNYLNVNFSQGVSRNRVDVIQSGAKAYSKLLGLCVLKQNSFSDQRFFVQHLKPSGVSRQCYRGVLDDSAQSVFHGKIHVHTKARNTDCKQSAKNLLLSNQARSCIQPELAIDCAEVKAQHGASSGELNQDELFYLQSRGLDKKSALKFLILAYINDVLCQFPEKKIITKISSNIQNKLLSL